MKKLLTDRRYGSKPRVAEKLDQLTRDNLLELVNGYIEKHWFGNAFPEVCDGYGYVGTDLNKLKKDMSFYQLIWPADVDPGFPPSDDQMFGLLEYSYEVLAEAQESTYHSYMQHYHYHYDQEAGRLQFVAEFNRVLSETDWLLN